MQYIGIAMVPLFILIAMYKYRAPGVIETVKRAFRKKDTYGPSELQKREEWKDFRRECKYKRQIKRRNWFHHIGLSLVGGYRWKSAN